MTIINNLEFDNITYIKNDIKSAIQNNDKIEDNLHVIMVISNPCNYKKRYMLAKDFIKRMSSEKDVILYIVEMTYKDQPYAVTEKDNPRHLQLNTSIPLWHKENMCNLGVKYLLPSSWKAMAWIDADLEFESASWASDTLKILNGNRDIVQLFSHAHDMNHNGNTMTLFSSFGYCYTFGYKYGKPSFWHPGYAWAMTRTLFEKCGGLFEYSILGSGDHNMAYALLNRGIASVNINASNGYKKSIDIWEKKISGANLGYVPGIIRHYFHGTKANRKYLERWQILIFHQYDPEKHIEKDDKGILVPSSSCPQQLLDDILQYSKERNEDDYLI